MSVAAPAFGPAITLDHDTHTYRVDGRVWPGVTKILPSPVDADAVPSGRMADAMLLGTHVHLLIQLYLEGDLDESTVRDELWPYLRAFQKFEADTGFKPRLVEQIVYSQKYQVIGMLDLEGELSRRNAVIDIKTGTRLSPVTRLQTAGYAGMLKECQGWRGTDRYALHLRKDGAYRLSPVYRDRNDWMVFLNFLTVWRWCQHHKLTPPEIPE